MNVLFEGNTKTGKDEWLTPPQILQELGEFDLDPCSPINRPWSTAKKHYTTEDNGLIQKWEGRVFCNPPYGDEAEDWMRLCIKHGNCIAFTFARTDTKWFQKLVFGSADALFFLQGRVSFYHSTGIKGGTAGAPSVLIAFGENNVDCLRNTKIRGTFVQLNQG